MCLRNLVVFQLPKVIYALKMSLFQKEYIISEDYVYSLNIFCQFILRFYAKAWYISRIAVIAFHARLCNYKIQNLKDLSINIIINNVIKKCIK